MITDLDWEVLAFCVGMITVFSLVSMWFSMNTWFKVKDLERVENNDGL